MKIGIVGAGNMARALVRGWAEPVLITDGGSGRAAVLAAEVGGEAVSSNAELAERAEVVVLCHKPTQLESVAAEMGDRARAVVSVLAATSIDSLRAAYPAAEVVRAMPNTPVELRQGVTCLCLAPNGDPGFAERSVALFERLGTAVVLPERLMEVATGLAGVAPAYVALVAEAQIDAAVRHGMPSAQAGEIVIAALAGSAGLLRVREGDTLAVRREVASPGGLTARGLDALERGGLRAAFSDALEAVLKGSSR